MSRGRLVYLIGPSGAGKDSLLRHVAEQIGPDEPIRLARRHITRPHDDPHEEHIAIDMVAFLELEAAGAFALAWRSHGFSYGVTREIDAWLADGCHVLVNGSRDYLTVASTLYPDLLPILIKVAPATLRQRLIARGREDAAGIDARLGRTPQFTIRHPSLLEISNDGPLERAGTDILEALRRLRPIAVA